MTRTMLLRTVRLLQKGCPPHSSSLPRRRAEFHRQPVQTDRCQPTPGSSRCSADGQRMPVEPTGHWTATRFLEAPFPRPRESAALIDLCLHHQHQQEPLWSRLAWIQRYNVRVRVRVRIRFSVWLVSGYAHVFVLVSIVLSHCPE